MKLSELWLRERIGSHIKLADLCQKLTLSGLEVESISPVVNHFSDIVVAEVLTVEPHPEADRLQVCTVFDGDITVSVVCGAKNVFAGMKAAFAKVGAVLPDGMKIRKAKLRGVVSEGMLCSASELELAEKSDGLIILPHDAPVGTSLREYMQLDDHVIEILITPNRGDCLSVDGLAQEISALISCTLSSLMIPEITPTQNHMLSVVVNEPDSCPRYVGRIIRQINVAAVTPLWLQERLRRSGLHTIHPIVDVMNYVMLELGQPMHAFDLAKLSGDICVRHARSNEKIALLDGREVTLNTNTLVIADQIGPQAIAGVMGGQFSAVTADTQDIFLESAFFQPQTIIAAVQNYQIASESSHRFERGVDPYIQKIAIERATQLILEIAGGEVCPMVEVQYDAQLPTHKKIILRSARLTKIIGLSISSETVFDIFTRLGFTARVIEAGWEVQVPARRFDIKLEIDLIEEIIRVYGYEKISPTSIVAHLQTNRLFESSQLFSAIVATLVAKNYHEVITYSFIDKKIQNLFDATLSPLELVNPMSSEMNVMRTSLWPGLIQVLQYNCNRQQTDVRIFESGNCFRQSTEQFVLAGLVAGSVLPLQWGVAERSVDFFDVKGDIENLLLLSGQSLADFSFQPLDHSALHPGQAASIYLGKHCVGRFGLLHPNLAKLLDLKGNIYLYELDVALLQKRVLPQMKELSKFPTVQRDIAILVDKSIPVEQIQATIFAVGGELLQSLTLFDVYQGAGIPLNKKSMAFSLMLQHVARTLTDDEVDNFMQNVYSVLQNVHAAELRSMT